MQTKVLIVDDHPVFRLGLKSLISNEEDFEVCGEAASVGEALRIVPSIRPDVAIVDLSLEQGQNGLELVQQLSSQTKILVCSFHDEEIFARKALAVGARGYIHKSEALKEIIQALQRIMEGDIYLSHRMSQRLMNMIRTGNHFTDDRLGSQILELSSREIQVFELLGKGYETRKIAERLELSPKTIAKHCENIMSKLGLSSKTKLLYRAILWVTEQKYS